VETDAHDYDQAHAEKGEQACLHGQKHDVPYTDASASVVTMSTEATITTTSTAAATTNCVRTDEEHKQKELCLSNQEGGGALSPLEVASKDAASESGLLHVLPTLDGESKEQDITEGDARHLLDKQASFALFIV
jgi:hypothetical protein